MISSSSEIDVRPDREDQSPGRGNQPLPAPARRPIRSTGIPGGARHWPRPKSENRPIFLSIGYSACHWCHVMEHESFENPEIAALMNEHFVNIKVDREERPDLDQIYMSAVMAMTGHGGWPMSVFLTPELQAILRRHLFSADRLARHGRFSPRAPERAPGLARTARRDHRVGGRDDRAIDARSARFAKGAGPLDFKLLDQAARTTHARLRPAPRRLRPGPQVSRTRWTSRALAAPPAHRRRPGAARRAAHARQDGPRAASTIIWAAASPAIRPTSAGWSRTSRKCSTTMRS